MKIFCVIPAYNEEKNIGKVLKNVLRYVDEIVVVDDCSQDNTCREVRRIKTDHERSLNFNRTNITLLRHPINRGQGAALQTGNSYSVEQEADIIVHFDADGQFLAEEITEVAKPVLNGEADACFGSRFLGKKSDLPFSKKNVILPLAKMINRSFFGIRTSDPQSGFRVLSRQVAENMEIEQDKMAHCSEILYKVHKQKFRIKEVPITVIYHEFGQNFGGGIKIIKDMIIKGLLIK